MSAQRGRLESYAIWQLRDYLMGPFIWTIIVTLALGVMPLVLLSARMKNVPGAPEQLATMYASAYSGMIGILASLGSLLGVARIVSADRQPGLSRFLFSKPINISMYYLQAWLVRGAALVALSLVAALVVNQWVAPVAWLPTVEYVAIAWLLIGGVGILISVLTAQDAGVLIGVYLLPDLLSGLHGVYPTWPWVKPLLTVMPPVHRLDELRSWMFGMPAAPQLAPALEPFVASEIWHIMGYGAGALALSLYLVRRLPLVR